MVNLKGHGKSGSFTEKLSIKAVAEDLAALINYFNIKRISAIGFSYGGDVLFQLALLRPDLIEAMISIGACGSWLAKDFPHFVEYLSSKNIASLPWMKEQQTSEEQIRTLLDQVANYNITVSEAEMKTIQSRILFVLVTRMIPFPWNVLQAQEKIFPTPTRGSLLIRDMLLTGILTNPN